LDKYRNFFSISKVDLFILALGITSFLDIFINSYNFYFVSIFFDLLLVLIVFAVLLPYSRLSLYLQKKYHIDNDTKFKLAIFLYFLTKGPIIIQYSFEPTYIFVYLVLILATGYSLSKWYKNNFLHKDAIISKNAHLLTLILLIITLVCKINTSFEYRSKKSLIEFTSLSWNAVNQDSNEKSNTAWRKIRSYYRYYGSQNSCLPTEKYCYMNTSRSKTR